MFKNHINYEANLKQDIVHKSTILRDTHQLSKEMERELQAKVQAYNEQEINMALNAAVENNGPVHINAPFDEPLYMMQETQDISPILISEKAKIQVEPSRITTAARVWSEAKRKLVLVGTLPPNTILQKYLEILAEDPSVMVLTETTSNLRDERFFNAIDQLILPIQKNEELLDEFQPDVMVLFPKAIERANKNSFSN